MNLSDCRLIITGAARGIGREFALSLCRAGATVAAFDIDQLGLDTVASEAENGPGRLYAYKANVAQEEEVIAAVEAAFQDCGHINGLINNAGIYRDGMLVKNDPAGVIRMPLTQWQAVIDVDLSGPFLMTREVAARMVAKSVKPGIVINISSISRHGNVGQSNYAAAKAGIIAETKVWAKELAQHGIRVAAIAPGFIRTPILRAMQPEVLDEWIAKIPLHRLGEPAEISPGSALLSNVITLTGAA